jgi:hypothetical protein
MSKEQVVGNIQFGNNKIGNAFSIIQEEYVEGRVWKEEFHKAEYALDKAIDEIADLKSEVNRLKKLLRSRRSKNVRG